jgi:hypothetical protein
MNSTGLGGKPNECSHDPGGSFLNNPRTIKALAGVVCVIAAIFVLGLVAGLSLVWR